jgi:hypothetical protein
MHGLLSTMRLPWIAAVLALPLAAAPLACRGIIGIEELSYSGADGGLDANVSPDPNRVPPGGEGAHPVEACTSQARPACVTCCKTGVFAESWSRVIQALGQGCLCGPDAPCGPACGGKPECPGSPAAPPGTPPQEECSACIERVLAVGNTMCPAQVTTCEHETSCQLAVACMRGCFH